MMMNLRIKKTFNWKSQVACFVAKLFSLFKDALNLQSISSSTSNDDDSLQDDEESRAG